MTNPYKVEYYNTFALTMTHFLGDKQEGPPRERIYLGARGFRLCTPESAQAQQLHPIRAEVLEHYREMHTRGRNKEALQRINVRQIASDPSQMGLVAKLKDLIQRLWIKLFGGSPTADWQDTYLFENIGTTQEVIDQAWASVEPGSNILMADLSRVHELEIEGKKYTLDVPSRERKEEHYQFIADEIGAKPYELFKKICMQAVYFGAASFINLQAEARGELWAAVKDLDQVSLTQLDGDWIFERTRGQQRIIPEQGLTYRYTIRANLSKPEEPVSMRFKRI